MKAKFQNFIFVIAAMLLTSTFVIAQDTTNDDWRNTTTPGTQNELNRTAITTTQGAAGKITFGNGTGSILTYGLNAESVPLPAGTKGVQAGLRGKTTSNYGKQTGYATGLLGYSKSFSGDGAFLGISARGLASTLSNSNNKYSRATGALLSGGTDDILNLQTTGKYYIGGVHAELIGTINNQPAGGAVAAVIGIDKNTGTAPSYASYFEGNQNYMSGKLGIGTKAPAEKLHINGAVRGNQGGAVRISTGNGYVDIGPKNAGWSHFYTDRPKYYFDKEIRVNSGLIGSYDENLSLRTQGTTRITILKSNGNVGVGTGSPSTKFDVNGRATCGISFTVGQHDDSYRGLVVDNGASSAWKLMELKNVLGTKMIVLGNGNVGIGRTNPIFKLEVAGAAYSTEDWYGSDKRYKENIKTIDSALDKINALDGVSYKFKQKTINDIDFSQLKQGNHLGFIAQDLEKVFPELIQKDEAGYYAVNYNGLIPVLVEGMKEQQEVITKQETEIEDLKSRMNKLEALLLNNSNNINDNGFNIQENTDFSNIVLKQNSPNPFSNETTIAYELPTSLNVAQLVIYDLNGKIITSYDIAGKGSVRFDSSKLSSGAYIYAIIADGKSVATQKMVIQK